MKVFDTGAVRSSDADDVRFDLISPIGSRRLAETYAEGAKKYGAHNWLKGFPASELVNHAERHVNLWKAGDDSEDHLAHAAWNLFALMHFEETRPELIDVPTRTENAPREPGKPRSYNEIAGEALCGITAEQLRAVWGGLMNSDRPNVLKHQLAQPFLKLIQACEEIERGLVPAAEGGGLDDIPPGFAP